MEGHKIDITKGREIIIDYLKNSNLKQYIKYNESEHTLPTNIDQKFFLTGRVPKSKASDLDEFRETLYDVLAEGLGNEFATDFVGSSEAFNIQVGLSEGEKFPEIEAADKEGNKVTIKHTSGKVLMVDYWATWCKWCQDPMQENVDLMTKNDHLISKNVEIVGLSCDKESQKWRTHIEERKWETIPQFVKPEAREQFGIKGIPCVLIVNKEGKVAYIGHPNKIDLEQTLVNLSEDKPVVRKNIEPTSQNAFWIKMDAQSKIDTVAESSCILRDAGVINAYFCVSTNLVLNEQFEMVPVKIEPLLYGSITQFEYDTLQTLTTTLKSKFNFESFAFNVAVMQIGADEDF